VKLGKKEYVHDDRTLMMGKYILPDITVPPTFDFDAPRRPFPVKVWGNEEYGDCVIAGEANQTLRLERIEAHRTVPLDDQDAIDRYKTMTLCEQPGDENDTGLEIIEAMRNWKNVGFYMHTRGRIFTIAAYGELDPSDRQITRAASYLLHGVQWGFWLPRAAQAMTEDLVWDYNGETGAEWKPGSWGGHCVYSKQFDEDSHTVLTWGREVRVSDSFIDRYADEAWAVVDSLDPWKKTQVLDVDKLEQELGQISSKVNR
jgi:hypothetical protein